MNLLCAMLSRAAWFVGVLGLLMAVAGCDSNGEITDRGQSGPGGPSTVDDRNLSGIAGPPDVTQLQPVERVPRAQYAAGNTVDALLFPSATAEEREVFQRALTFFITDRTPENGLGPIFNQPICLGCHRNADDIASLTSEQMSGAPLATVSTPASRAGRQGPTDHARLNQEIQTALNTGRIIGTDETFGKPPTAAFTLFGDFFPASGAFNPLSEFGGPIQHIRTTGSCYPDIVPPESIDPFLRGGIDPITGLSVLGGRRTIGERAGPPYVGRGLMEAVFAEDVAANDDPEDALSHTSSLEDPSVATGCRGDCISGRHNENQAAAAFIGGDPVIRVARLGLRAAGPTLLQFMIGGSQGEVGLTSPFSPNEQGNNQNVGRNCDIAPDPELTNEDILNLRRLLRLIAIPDLDPCLLGTSNTCLVEATGTTTGTSATMRGSIENGAVLFGVDLAAFRSRMISGQTPVGDPQGINQTDRQLNCVGCHTPVMRTGQSPAELGAQHLSNRWVPLFSDLSLHDMGNLPQGPSNPIPPDPTRHLLRADGTFELSRNLADFALPGQGSAFGSEWRTPPLMGIGRVGPPFLHDARVYLSNRNHPSGDPQRRATTVRSNSTITNERFTITTVDETLLAAIELHDLPDPVGVPFATGRPEAAAGSCPVTTGGSAAVICPPLTAPSRSEARNVMQRWRTLTPQEQQDVMNFLKAL